MAITVKDKQTGTIYTSEKTAAPTKVYSSPKGTITVKPKTQEAKPFFDPSAPIRYPQPAEPPTVGERIASIGSSVLENTVGGVKAAGAMLLNRAQDLDENMGENSSQRKALENSAAQLEYYESLANRERQTEAERKKWQMRADNARRAAEMLGVLDEREHPLDKPIETITQSAQENRTAANKAAMDATRGLDGAGAVAADAALTIGNMLPAIGAGFVNPALGATLLGVTSGGNDYLEQLAEGRTEKEAALHGTIIGGLEGLTQYALGGISKLGGVAKIPSVTNKIGAMNRGVVKALAQLGVNTASEITEEELQLFLQPLVDTVMYDEAYDVPTVEDMVYTALITALSTGVLEAPTAIATGRTPSAAQQTAPNAAGEREVEAVENSAPVQESAAQAITAPSAPVAEANNRILVYRGFNRSDNPLERNLAEMRTVYDYIGDGNSPIKFNGVPLAFYTDSQNDARQYADMDMSLYNQLLENARIEYRQKIMDGENFNENETQWSERRAKESYKILTGKDKLTSGYVDEFYISPKKTLDLTSLGEEADVDDIYRVISKETGINENELDEILMLANDFETVTPVFKILRNEGGRNTATKIVKLMENLGYDAVSYAESGATHYALLQNAETNNSVQAPQTDGLGAADAGFDPISQAELRYGTQDGGVNAVRPDDVPVSTDGITKVSEFAVSAKGAQITPDEFVPLIENKVMEGKFSFVPITNNETTERAKNFIMTEGWDGAVRSWEADIRANKSSAETTAIGALLYNNAVNKGDRALAMEILGYMNAYATNTAQSLQAFRIFKALTPDNQLYSIQKSLDAILRDAKIDKDIKISDDLRQRYIDATTDAERNAVLDEISKEIGAQLPVTVMDKWNALRFTNMLGNFKTQFRNVFGNTLMTALQQAKNAVSVGMQNLAYAVSGGRLERTRGLPTKELISIGSKAFDTVKSIAMGEGRYSLQEGRGNFGNDVLMKAMNERRIFNTSLLEGYRRLTNNAMEKGDEIFSRANFSFAFASYLKAHNVTAEMYNDPAWQADNTGFINKALDFAIKDAQEATFRDKNWFSQMVSRMGRGKDTPTWASVISEGMAPFRRTPANVMMRGIEYSPLGIVNTVIKTIRKAAKVKDANGNPVVTGADIVDQLAKTLSGSALVYLGFVLYNSGNLTASEDADDDQQYYNDLQGMQNMALVMDDGSSYTIDWATPVASPLLFGAEIAKFREEGIGSGDDLMDILQRITDPILNQAMLQGVNDAIDMVQYEGGFGDIVTNLAINYAMQGLTNSLLGQIERTSEEVRMMNYTTRDSLVPTEMQRQLGKASAKTPIWEYQQVPYIDAWGRMEESGSLGERIFENFISPGYSSEQNTTALERELQRIVDASDDVTSSLFPDNAPRSFKVNGKTKYLTPEEYVEYATAKGQDSRKYAEDLLANKLYRTLTDEQKASAISKAFEFANAEAKEDVSNYRVAEDDWINSFRTKSDLPLAEYLLLFEKEGGAYYLTGDGKEKMDKAVSIGMSRDDYLHLRKNIDADDNGNVSQEEAKAYLNSTDLTREQKRAMWNVINKGWKNNPY